MTQGPLSGIKVLDLTQALAGPFGSMILADLGAEVIKIEPPSGDLTRTTPPHYIAGSSLYFIANNRNKRSVVLDLKQAHDLETFYALVRHADVVFYNFSLGVVERLKIDPASLLARNPRLVVCIITGFGREGPNAARRAVDLVIQSLAGAMSLTGEPDGAPVRAGVPTADLSCGLFATIGILAALQERQRTGKGGVVETSLFHAQASLLNYIGSYALYADQDPQRLGSAHPGTVPSQTFRAADGWITIDAGFNKHFETLCNVLDRKDLSADPRYADRSRRNLNRVALLEALSVTIANWPVNELVARLSEQGVPCGSVATVREALNDPQSAAYGMVRHARHGGEALPVLATPLWFGDRADDRTDCVPRLGEHTSEVLEEWLGNVPSARTGTASAATG
jgi:crotonobetainyl-CoA:carnitine CoA-transferase CaiB-like acyl-CoA transferase